MSSHVKGRMLKRTLPQLFLFATIILSVFVGAFIPSAFATGYLEKNYTELPGGVGSTGSYTNQYINPDQLWNGLVIINDEYYFIVVIKTTVEVFSADEYGRAIASVGTVAISETNPYAICVGQYNESLAVVGILYPATNFKAYFLTITPTAVSTAGTATSAGIDGAGSEGQMTICASGVTMRTISSFIIITCVPGLSNDRNFHYITMNTDLTINTASDTIDIPGSWGGASESPYLIAYEGGGYVVFTYAEADDAYNGIYDIGANIAEASTMMADKAMVLSYQDTYVTMGWVGQVSLSITGQTYTLYFISYGYQKQDDELIYESKAQKWRCIFNYDGTDVTSAVVDNYSILYFVSLNLGAWSGSWPLNATYVETIWAYAPGGTYAYMNHKWTVDYGFGDVFDPQTQSGEYITMKAGLPWPSMIFYGNEFWIDTTDDDTDMYYNGEGGAASPSITSSATSQSTIPTSPYTPQQHADFLLIIVPLAILCMPALALGAYFGVAGLLFGAVLGVGIGVSTGWLPNYLVVLLGLLTVGFFFTRVQSRGTAKE